MTDIKNSPRRGRPRRFDPDDAARQAMCLFHRYGYEGVGIAELSDAIGVNPPSLYAAFGSKRGLFERAIAIYEAEAGTPLRKALASSGPAAIALRELLVSAAELYSRDPDRPGCLVMDAADNCSDPTVCAITAGRKEALRSAIQVRLTGEAPAVAGRLADFVMLVLRGLSASARDGQSGDALVSSAELAADAAAGLLESASMGRTAP